MFQPDEPNGIRNCIILWIIGFILFYILFTIHGCATKSETPEVYCPSPELVNYKDHLVKEFVEHVQYAQDGCIRHYGPRACLIKLTRKGYRDYHATCQVMPESTNIDYSL